MKKLKIYLDNCCFNRPYDNQNSLIIKIETEVKIAIQECIKNNTFNLCWSYILDFENENNPFPERRIEICKWKKLAIDDTNENDSILENMKTLVELGFKPLDSLHISCAIKMNCDYFITVDKGIIKKSNLITTINIVSPIDFIFYMEDKKND